MDDLSESFVNEANELLESLEEALLKLENHPDDKEEINTAFRVMHSLKGTGAMFGFDELSAFTHEMESLYDLVRSGKRKPDKKLIDFTFKSIDLIRKLLDKSDDAETLSMKHAFLEELKSIFPSEETNISSKEEDAASKKPKSKPKKKKYPATWYIHFEPHRDILKNGTRPLYLLDELAEAGRIKTFLHTENLPEFEHLIVENVYVSWDLLIATDKEKSFLKDVFIFVEDDSRIKIEKLSENDLLSHPDFEKQVKTLELTKSITPEKLQQLTAALSFPEKEKTLQPEEVAEKEYTEEPESDLKPGDKPGKDDVQQKILHETVRVPSVKLDELLDIISELVTTQARLLHYS